MSESGRAEFEEGLLRYGRFVTLTAAVIYATAAFALRVPETLAFYALGLALVGPFILRDVLFHIAPSIVTDFVSALVAPLVVTLLAVTGLPLGRVLAVSAGLSLAFSTLFTVRRAIGAYGPSPFAEHQEARRT